MQTKKDPRALSRGSFSSKHLQQFLHRHHIDKLPVQNALIAKYADFAVTGFPVQALPETVEGDGEQDKFIKPILFADLFELVQEPRPYAFTAMIAVYVDRQVAHAVISAP